MKNQSAKLLFFLLCVPGVLLLDLSRPAPGLSVEYRVGSATANVNLRKTPGLQGDIVAGLPKGSPVKVYGEKDGWYLISSKKNYILFKGWVYKPYIEVVSAPVATTPSGAQPPQATPAALTEKPPPAPVEKPTPPAPVAKPPSRIPALDPDQQAAAKPIAPDDVATAKTEQPARSPKVPGAGTDTRPAGTLRLLLSVSPLVLAAIALLIAVRAYRAARVSSGKIKPPEIPAEPAPAKEKPMVSPEEPPVKEKRQALRTNRLIEVDFAVAGKFYRGFINNMSETGAYLDTRAKCSVGQEITISCPSIDTGGHIKRSGLIIRKTDVGYAVHFQQND